MIQPLNTLDIDYLLTQLDKSFYTMPLMIVLNIVFLLAAIRYRSVERSYRIFVLYATLFLIENVAGFITQATFWQTIGAFAVLCFTLVEFSVFYYFFCQQLNRQPIRNKLVTIGQCYLPATILLTLYASLFPFPLSIKSLTAGISFTNSLLILIPACYYFYTLFIEPPLKNLLHEPGFWITTGITFLHALNIPILFIENYIFKQQPTTVWTSISPINYIAYCILFILLIISLLCKGENKTPTLLNRLPAALL